MSASLFQVTGPLGRRRNREILSVPNHLRRRRAPRLAFAPAGTQASGDILVVIFQRGGMDGLSALIPFGEGADYYDIRPTIAVREPGQTKGALDIGGGFGLHPALLPFKNLFDAGQLAVVRATGCVDPTRSHFDAMRYMEQGVPGDKTVATGWLGRHLESVPSTNDSPVRAVGFGSLVQASLRGTGAYTPLAMETTSDFSLYANGDYYDAVRAELETEYHTSSPASLLDRQASAVFQTMDLLDSLNGTTYTPENGAVYRDDYFNLQLQQVAQLIKADVGLEVACVDIGGFDTHETTGVLDGTFNDLMQSLATGIGALHQDLGSRMAKITIVTMSEFGRRVQENASKGTDHGHGNCMFVLGGGVNGGSIYGAWPGLASNQLDDGDLFIPAGNDQRHVLAELISKRLANGASLAQVFPNFTAAPLGIFKT